MRTKNTYWVEYTYKYKYWDSVENDWVDDEDFDARRFHCSKKDIKKEVDNAVHKELSGENIKDLIINIVDCYPTTDCEI